VNESDPVLNEHLGGDELKQVQNTATGLKFQSEYLAGPPLDTSGAIVKQLVGAAAVVADCNIDQSVLMNGRTNQVVKPATAPRQLVNAKVELSGGVWKVTELSNVGVTCTSAS
jgi:hypothetical protein